MQLLRYTILTLIAIIIGLVITTAYSTHQTTQSLEIILANTQVIQVYDRNGDPLSVSYQNRWNKYDNLPLYQIPEFLQTAFIASEDRHFYQHNGVDWSSRARALLQNFTAQHTVSGASSITEQVVRIIHPRPRNIWSKWLEGFDAYALEKHFPKNSILEFYLNQLPYAANRRGVLQAARYYFNRDLGSLSHKEMLALVVLARSPTNFDLYKNPHKLDSAIDRLALYLQQQGKLTPDQTQQIKTEVFHLQKPQLPVNAKQFIDYVRTHPESGQMQPDALHTTLDSNLQRKSQALLDERLKNLVERNVHNGAVLVVDHATGEILAWAVAGNAEQSDHTRPQGYQFDSVTTLRQPGSTLKPFLYSLALEKGWTAATLIEDAPTAEAIGTGLHRFKNYSHGFYGQVTLREALGNSLNVPAIQTINFVGVKPFLNLLHQLGFDSLTKPASYYDVGLALGDGEVNLLELVRAYSVLANEGIMRPLRYQLGTTSNNNQRILSPEITSLIANILSDPWARQAEFGVDNILNLPVQTAVKTGTSTDYHDAWAVGFNYRYTVGVWLGNLDQKPMDGVTGAIGPALILRSVFAELNRHQVTQPLPLSERLVKKEVCVPEIIWQGKGEACHMRNEYFIPGHVPDWIVSPPANVVIKLTKPSEGLRLAIDPRIPLAKQAFEFKINGVNNNDQTYWFIDGKFVTTTSDGSYLWPLSPGQHQVSVQVYRQNKLIYQSGNVSFLVKQ